LEDSEFVSPQVSNLVEGCLFLLIAIGFDPNAVAACRMVMVLAQGMQKKPQAPEFRPIDQGWNALDKTCWFHRPSRR
jgi:hypothetical protein